MEPLTPPGVRPRILFCSWHGYLDPSSGASLATRDLLEILAARGWDCGAFSSTGTDFEQGVALDALLDRRGVEAEVRAGDGFDLRHFTEAGVRVTLFRTPGAPTHAPPSRPLGERFLQVFDAVLSRFRPDLVLTYGGTWPAAELIARARGRGLKVVFFLLNDAYQDREFFRTVDAVAVHSGFAAEFYRRRLEIDCCPLPCPLMWRRFLCDRIDPRYVAFVNPQPVKGAGLFARLALELGRKRPDIPLLVVDGRGGAGWLARCGLDLSGLKNLHHMTNTPDPRQFYSVSRVVLMPSLWEEMFGRVAAEAMGNGIPVVVSDRGGLPRTVGEAGLVLTVPPRYDGKTRHVPTAQEVAPWVAAIERLWDDADFFEDRRAACLRDARRWDEGAVAGQYGAFFHAVLDGSAPRPLGGGDSGGRAMSESPPAISVVMPVYNGAAFLNRAFDSLSRQRLGDWELLAVDDASTDDSYQRLRALASDPRVRVFRHAANAGPSAARNTALRQARGRVVAYLDADDEFYPDHLARILEWSGRGDVLVFRYDLVEERPGPGFGRVRTYDPAPHHERLPRENIVVPLGVAHRREVLTRSGLFDESLRFNEDGDLWRRFARAGASFVFVPEASGKYHIRSDSQARRYGQAEVPAVAGLPTAVTVAEVQAGPNRHQMWVPEGDAGTLRDVLEGREYAKVAAACLRVPPVAVDVGANVGAFALYVKLHYHPDSTVHCFEPYPPVVELLRRNVGALGGVHVHAVALADHDGDVVMHLHPYHAVSNSIKAGVVPEPSGHVTVPVRAAGPALDGLGLGEIDLLKIDAEGSEVEILTSLGERLGRVRVVIAEFHGEADRRRIDALLPCHVLIALRVREPGLGVVQYVRSDLLPAGRWATAGV